ncbi:MAG: polysaccharide biosynthesis tyrosine autokinase [Anaerolineae bacterium]|nr:polysaccharide biosynthesis tyrosine autokinase [Anaerolineae bacterium]
MNFLAYTQILWRRKWVIFLTALVTVAVAAVGSTLATPTYTATATLRILTSSSGIGAYQDYDVQYAERLMRTYAEIATSAPVLDELKQTLDLDYTPDVQTEALASTELMSITAQDENAVRAAQIANTLSEILIGRSQSLYTGDAQETTASLIARLDQIEQELNDAQLQYESLLDELPEGDERIAALSRSIEMREQVYAALLTQYEEIRTADAMRANAVSLIEPASPPKSPSSPNKPLNIVLGALVGLAGGTALAFLFENMDTRLYTVEQICETAGLPVLGRIPSARRTSRPVLYADGSLQAEAFRRLRTNLISHSRADPLHKLLIASALPGEGKSTVAANLAVAMAQTGQRVVVVDADLRRPVLHTVFDLPNETGVSLVLQGEADLSDAVQDSGILDVHVLSSGPPLPNPVEMLDSDEMASLLDHLAEQYDVVLVDTPAFLPVTDAAVLVPNVDGVMLVAGRTQARKETVSAASDQLDDLGARMIGLVVTRSDHHSGYYHHYHPEDKDSRVARARSDTPGALLSQARAAVQMPQFSLRRWVRGLSFSGAAAWLKRTAPAVLSGWDVAAVIVLLGWILAYAHLQQAYQNFVGTDAVIHYFPAAQAVLDGEGYRAFEADVHRGPGYPLMLAAASHLLDIELFAASEVVGGINAALFLLFTYLLIRRVFNAPTALAGVLVIVATNMFVWNANTSNTDVPFAWLAVASVYFLMRCDRPGYVGAVSSGILAGLALIVRWTGLILPVCGLIWIALVSARALDLRGKARIVVVYLLAFLAACGPWLYANYLLHDNPLYNRNATNLDPEIFSKRSDSFADTVIDSFNDNPQDFVRNVFNRLVTDFPDTIQGFNDYPHPGGWVMAGLCWVLILVGGALLLIRINRVQIGFLLISAIWWGPIALTHYEARYYIPLLPLLAALGVYIVTGDVLPDIKLNLGERKISLSRGHLLDRLAGSRLPGWLAANPSGAGLTGVVAACVLVFAVSSALDRAQNSFEWTAERDEFYHELTGAVRELPDVEHLRPIGVRQWSQAQYWLPTEAGAPTALLPREQNIEAVLPNFSYVLYDQINPEDSLVDWWDNPGLAALMNPLRAPASLEIAYFKPTAYRAVLYRVLDENVVANIEAITTTSAEPEGAEALVMDRDIQTWWSSRLRNAPNADESIVFDLGRRTTVNRVWLLPRPDGAEYPLGLHIDVSVDGVTWEAVARVWGIPTPLWQSPQVYTFDDIEARFVRITSLELPYSPDQDGYVMSFAEARISRAVEQSPVYPVFAIEPADVYVDALDNELVARIENQGTTPGQIDVAFYEGWSADSAVLLATVESEVIGPGETGFARLPSDRWSMPDPGQCRPIWVTLEPPSYANLTLRTYGVTLPEPQRVFADQVCTPEEVVVDDFSYPDSPLDHSWRVPEDQVATGEVFTTYDSEMDRRVMQISSDAEEGYMLYSHAVESQTWQELALWIKSTTRFIVYVRVRDTDGDFYYLQYMPFARESYADEYPDGNYIYYALGSRFADGRWHRIHRDIYKDFYVKTGLEVDQIQGIFIRAYGDVRVTDLSLAMRR